MSYSFALFVWLVMMTLIISATIAVFALLLIAVVSPLLFFVILGVFLLIFVPPFLLKKER